MTLAPGTSLGPYEVIAALGAGGMGEVYRARDTRLARDVAVKVLPRDFLEGEDRRERFEREAKLLAALNHPGIAAIYSFEEIPGSSPSSYFLVMELLEGETLRARLAGGALPVRKAVDYAAQIARGLAAAHEKGVVHRDLKPENLFVTKDGRIKILDFGLAKAVEAGGSSGTNLPTQSKGTEPGTVLGTLGYMSPEQLRGLPADHRTDLFSLGAVLYEMLSGRRAFRGDTAADTVSAILKEEPPDLSETTRTIPPALERIVRHCLEKSPDERARSAHDVAFDLESFSTVSSDAVSAVAPVRVAIRRPPAGAVLAAAACVAAGVLAGALLWKRPAPAVPTFHRLTFRRGNVISARFAPDGRTIVYGASWGGAPSEIFTVRTESPESRALGLPNATVASVSSTGELALFSREGMTSAGAWATLSRVPLSGGAPRPLLEETTAADWTPDGKELAVVRLREGGGRRVELPAGKLLYETKNRIGPMRVSPDGRNVALGEANGEQASLLVVDLSGNARTLVGPVPILGSFAWLPSGREILYYGGNSREDAGLRAADLSGRVRTLYRSTGFLFVHDVFPDGRVLLEHAASLRGLMFARAFDKQEKDLSWFDSSHIEGVSSEGKAILFSESGDATGGSPRAFIRKTDGSPAVRIGDGSGIALCPDATRALVHDGDGVAIVPVGAGAPQRLALGSIADVRAAAFLPDGRKILLYGLEKGKGTRFWTVEPPGEPVPVSPENTQGNAGLLSPDGRRVIVWSADTSILSVLTLGGGAAVPLQGTEHDDPAGWTADGKGLYVRPGGGLSGRIEILDVATLARRPWKTLAPPDPASVSEIRSIVFARDGSAYAYTYRRVLTSDLYVVEGLK